MKNRELARMFEAIADSLEFEGESPFRFNAYRRAARAMMDLSEDIEEIHRRGELMQIPGVGSKTAEKIEEYLKTGKMQRYEEARKHVTPSLLELMRIPGLGPKRLKIIHDKLNVNNLEELEAAAQNGRLNELPGMGQKTAENILRGIKLVQQAGKRIPLGLALPVVEELVDNLRKAAKIERCLPAGSLRRMRETIGDIDILATGADGRKIVNAFTKLPDVRDVLAKGDTKGSIITDEGLQVDLRVVPEESYGAALQYFTGSKAHNIRLREIARKKNLKVNEYGVFRGEKSIGGETEEEVYDILGLPWIPPTLREDRGEIQAALEGELPEIVTIDDIRGDLHVHSKWSDGRFSIEDMVNAAKKLGYEYVAISDHSQSTVIAGGLNVEQLHRQMEEIQKLRKKIKGIQILTSTEMDIKPDGELDYPDGVLAELDIVTASIHAGFKQDRKTLTSRVLKAVENPHVDIIGHPTGRLVNSREGYDIDLETVMKAAAETGTALEVNSQWERLDLDDVAVKRAVELGVKEHVVNTWQLKKLREWLNRAHVEV